MKVEMCHLTFKVLRWGGVERRERKNAEVGEEGWAAMDARSFVRILVLSTWFCSIAAIYFCAAVAAAAVQSKRN